MDQTQFLVDGWEPVLRILLVGTLGYVWLALLLRGTGPRNMAKMTPFDFIITVTLGSAFGRVITASEVSLVEAVVTFSLLVALQWLFAAGRARWPRFQALVDPGPTLLFHDGRPVGRALRRHRMIESDLHSAARENGYGSLEDVAAVVLQADGTLAVIGASTMGDGSSVHPFTGTRED
ncbi:YetF domain-containing protein [Klenkia sp. LSe6-5]|uniref:YetF domain-containing protein n=1 Tax=Klenkia sesuvii TaxID=3103137 RepID=A0ABU8DTY2_9ACTN